MSDISKRSKSIKKKKKKDPKAPKRPRSAYILFCTKMRSTTKADNPNDKPAELMKKMGEQWKNMSDDDKRPYEEEAKEDKDRYQSEMSNYSAPDGSDDDESDGSTQPKRGKKKTGKKAKDPNAPKKAMSAYLMFGQTQRPKIKAENPSLKSAEIMKKIAEEWKKLSAAEKAPYEQMAKADKQRFDNESGAASKKAKPKPASDEDDDDDDDDDDGSGGGGGDDDDEDDDDDDDD